MQPVNTAGLAGSVHKTFLKFGALCLGLSLGLLFSGLAVAQTFTEFEAPGAGTAAFQGTVAISINTSGVIAGEYYDSTGVSHGFVRTAAGDITSFEASGAGTASGQGTFSGAINTAGTIAGNYSDSKGDHHGFVRTAAGAITTFTVSGAGTASGQGTSCCDINSSGMVSGFYIDKTKSVTASCALRRAPSPHITLRARVRLRVREPEAAASTTPAL